MAIRINVGALSLQPGATTNDALDLADYVQSLCPAAEVVVVKAGKSASDGDTADEKAYAAGLLSGSTNRWLAALNAGRK
jgi:hypothetical protein